MITVTPAPALKAALRAYSGSEPIDPTQCLFVYTHPSGFREPLTYSLTAGCALDRIEALEKELMDIYADPWINRYRESKRRESTRLKC